MKILMIALPLDPPPLCSAKPPSGGGRSGGYSLNNYMQVYLITVFLKVILENPLQTWNSYFWELFFKVFRFHIFIRRFYFYICCSCRNMSFHISIFYACTVQQNFQNENYTGDFKMNAELLSCSSWFWTKQSGSATFRIFLGHFDKNYIFHIKKRKFSTCHSVDKNQFEKNEASETEALLKFRFGKSYFCLKPSQSNWETWNLCNTIHF